MVCNSFCMRLLVARGCGDQGDMSLPSPQGMSGFEHTNANTHTSTRVGMSLWGKKVFINNIRPCSTGLNCPSTVYFTNQTP